MKRLLAIVLMIGLLAVSLMGCNQNDADASATSDTTVATADAPNDAGTESASSVEDADSAPEPELHNTDVADAETEAATDEATSRSRGPIAILGNADFTEENGVLGGAGTEEDPYIIAGWEIVVPSGSHYGVRIENVSAQFVLRGLVIQNANERNGAGIRVGFADGGRIEGCSVANSMNGIDIVSSIDILVDNCVLYVNGRGLRVVGETQEQYRHAIAETNLYNNHPIYYFYGLDGETISDLKGGHLTIAGSRNMTIRNNEVVNGDGLQLAFVEDSTVTLNIAHRTANVMAEHGIQLYESHNNVLERNLVKNNRLAGIQLTLSHDNRLVDNQVLVNDVGIRLLASQDNTVFENYAYANATGILILGGSSGNTIHANSVIDEHENMVHAISLETAMDNEVSKNLIFGSEMGLVLDPNSRRNTMKENTIVGGGYGIYVEGSDNTFENNLLTQHSRGILFPETFQRSITQGNLFRGNVLADNGLSHVYTNMDSTANQFTENVFLNNGQEAVIDQGSGNLWRRSR